MEIGARSGKTSPFAADFHGERHYVGYTHAVHVANSNTEHRYRARTPVERDERAWRRVRRYALAAFVHEHTTGVGDAADVAQWRADHDVRMAIVGDIAY